MAWGNGGEYLLLFSDKKISLTTNISDKRINLLKLVCLNVSQLSSLFSMRHLLCFASGRLKTARFVIVPFNYYVVSHKVMYKLTH